MTGPQRVRRPIAERTKDFLERECPLDTTGDQRLADILAQLTDDLERRAGAARSVS